VASTSALPVGPTRADGVPRPLQADRSVRDGRPAPARRLRQGILGPLVGRRVQEGTRRKAEADSTPRLLRPVPTGGLGGAYGPNACGSHFPGLALTGRAERA